MKNIIFILLLLNIFKGYGQVIADPAVSDMKVVNTQQTQLNPALLPKDIVIKIKIPIYNRNITNSLPSGTCKIKVGLGSKLSLDPAFNLTTANTSNYFQWTADATGGQVLITGDLVAVLPADFTDTLTLDIVGTVLGNSTVTTNFLITNHNTTINLSDENGTNNNTFLPYTVVVGGPLPVTFKDFVVTKKQCDVLATIYTENEINVRGYELQVSTDGISYETKAWLAANGSPKYVFTIADGILQQSARLFFRVKSIDLDGQYQYSETRMIAGGCGTAGETKIILFPNPAVAQQKEVFIELQAGVFNGKYRLNMYDDAGRFIQGGTFVLNNTNRINYTVGHLPAGQYFLHLSGENGTVYPVMKFQKL